MARTRASKKQAAEIVKLRNEGWSDQRIIAEKGSGAIAEGFRWLEQNPGADPLDRPPATSAAAQPARGTGSGPTPERTSSLI
jgi:hypothetical protein